ncbi:hypothetical protein K7X08_001195 [Anisodus acutangulus]|uniref:Uncharacterized protein n=1 Tax=Anisodus acutangulus TaxID=402998 RepID=A0A9Q1MNH9_9SOLA|nr:hypothetical protein K7X08_001195 [Anisodus acutangulus]
MANGEGEEKRKYPVLEGLGSMVDVARELSEEEDDDDDETVDDRAEKFIERFYEEIKMQRQESLLEQFNAMGVGV